MVCCKRTGRIDINSILEDLQSKLDSLIMDLDELRGDVQFIKTVFEAKEAKDEKRREKRRRKRLKRQLEEEAVRDRRFYEGMVRELRGRPWQFMPMPKSSLTRKELQLMSLMLDKTTDAEIARGMNIKERGVSARISSLNEKLKLNSRKDLIDFYLNYLRSRRGHRSRRCFILLSWLLNPPAGLISCPNIKVPWKKTLGKSKTLRKKGVHISDETFESFRPYEVAAMRLLVKGLDNSTIATRLKIKESTVKTYFAEIRAAVKRISGVTIGTDRELVQHFRRHPRFR